MFVLGLDCAGLENSVALWHDGVILAELKETPDKDSKGSGDRFMPLVQKAFFETALRANQLDRIAVNTGPGSFTGIRIALAAAQGLNVALDIPVFGIDVFQLYEADAPKDYDALVVVIESRRTELYIKAITRDGDELLPMQSMAPDDIAALGRKLAGSVFCGDGMAHLAHHNLNCFKKRQKRRLNGS